MKTKFENIKNSFFPRTLYWSLVVVYTLLLPYAISIYNFIEKHFSSRIAGKVPLVIILIFGIVYIVAVIKMKKGIKSWLLLLPCTIIVYAFLRIEPNPNKHIHIPEYIVMTWLLFEVLSIDYNGKGILVLVFICSNMLGIVDELMQGILPGRYYGWHDMIMNSAASVVGALTLAGLRTIPAGDWTWIGCFAQLKKTLAITFFGAVGVVFTCVYLLDVQTDLTFWGTYPSWLLGWNGLFMVAGLIIMFYPGLLVELAKSKNNKDSSRADQTVTARLWTLCPLVILTVMHGLVVFTALSGFTFS